ALASAPLAAAPASAPAPAVASRSRPTRRPPARAISPRAASARPVSPATAVAVVVAPARAPRPRPDLVADPTSPIRHIATGFPALLRGCNGREVTGSPVSRLSRRPLSPDPSGDDDDLGADRGEVPHRDRVRRRLPDAAV